MKAYRNRSIGDPTGLSKAIGLDTLSDQRRVGLHIRQLDQTCQMQPKVLEVICSQSSMIRFDDRFYIILSFNSELFVIGNEMPLSATI